MQSICLSMIVRQEQAVIARCLRSIKHLISSYAIVDTGSTDDTITIIKEELKDIPGEVISREWQDFATGRNQALELARKTGAEFILTLDADEELVWPEGWELPHLTDDIYGIRFRMEPAGEQSWTRSFIVRANAPWQWKGVVHEYIDIASDWEPEKTLITGKAYIKSYTDGARANTDKYTRDAEALKRALDEDPTDARYWFYLAQSYAGMRLVDKAIETYEKRVAMGGWDEEVFISLYQIACLMQARGDAWTDVARAFLRAFEYRPTRAEPLYMLAVLHNDHNEPAIAELYARHACMLPRPPDCLHVHETVYEFRAADEWAAALGRLGRNAEALTILKRLVEIPGLPDEELNRARENIEYLSC